MDQLFKEFSQDKKVLFIRFPEALSSEHVKEVKKAINRWMEANEKVLLFDLRGTQTIDEEPLDVLVNFLKLIHLNEKRVTSTRPDEKLYEKLSDRGLSQHFNFRNK